MSRKCPKRNHLFLNWLRANRPRFLFLPRLLRCRKRSIEFGFERLTPTLKFALEFTASRGPWISVVIVRKDVEREEIAHFYGAEHFTSKGWTSLALRQEELRYFSTREEVWSAICFDSFLAWCNEELQQLHQAIE